MSNDDGDWKPNGRPQSTMARNFSASLNDAFAINDNSLDGLLQSVEQKKQAVNSQSQELEALEARIRETEERLKQQQSRTSSPAGKTGASNSPHRRKPLGDTFAGHENDRPQLSAASPLSTQAPTTQSVSASTMSRWRPAASDFSSPMGRDRESMPINQSSGQQDDRYSE
ncbi:hypothetical protein N7G274_000926 [Stereocaulon virgatum]|uniref:Uncharacterized protein n=1 Tax=Stereocaulon virgatum TaxID=373712 RepID=A0ABR4AP69_9LECA